MVKSCDTVDGIGDHDTVFVKSLVTTCLSHPNERKGLAGETIMYIQVVFNIDLHRQVKGQKCTLTSGVISALVSDNSALQKIQNLIKYSYACFETSVMKIRYRIARIF